MRFIALLLAVFIHVFPALARDAAPVADIAAAELPAEARQTLELIRKGGPFPYRQDGVVFGNREKLLPPRPRGHYREYTVRTPGVRDRGARRIITGSAAGGDAKTANEYWYSEDHYNSFRRIAETKRR